MVSQTVNVFGIGKIVIEKLRPKHGGLLVSFSRDFGIPICAFYRHNVATNNKFKLLGLFFITDGKRTESGGRSSRFPIPVPCWQLVHWS